MTPAQPTPFRLPAFLGALVVLGAVLVSPAHGRTGPTPSALPTAPEWYPPTRAGWPGGWLDPRDPAPYLAFHQAAAMQSKSARRAEPTPNQALYDARYYALDLDLDPTALLLSGTVTVALTVGSGPLGQVELDLADNMAVSSLTCAGLPATYTHTGGILRVDLDRDYATGEPVVLVVQYSGNPEGSSFGWDTAGGRPVIWTLSEAFGARAWWPCKDYPDDKADSVDVRVTVPSGLITASNGTLRQQSDDGVRAFTWWHESHPITTYLVSLAIHPYHVYSDWYHSAGGDSTEIRFYNYPSSIPRVEPVQAKVKEMMAVFADRFGEYPFLNEKYGHAEFPWGGGMEHQTCTSLGYFGQSVVVHELGHQWWGDMVTCATFHDIWLNEGMATYSEAIYAEAVGGAEAYRSEMQASRYFGAGTIYVPDTSNWYRIFDGNLSYNKASWIPHMLRGMMGDSTFFAALGEFRNRFAYASAATDDFREAMEDVSGLDLAAFFQQWIHGEYYPIYQYEWTAAAAGTGWDLTLTVNQVQTWQLFTMPIPVEVVTAGGSVTFQVQDSQAHQVFTLHTEAEPVSVALDPQHWILRQVAAPLPSPAFDRSILLVNGCDWSTLGTSLTTAYQDRSFTGDYAVDFWDAFAEPAGGYPAPLPAPLGHGPVTPEVLGRYRTVVWTGNNYGGDLNAWLDSPIYSYLRAGGNLLLLARQGSQYLGEPLASYLGITFLGTGTVNDCVATHPELADIASLGTQDQVSGFSTSVGPETTLLYKAVSGHTPNWGIGAIRIPSTGGTHNALGGRLAFLGGRPYRWNHADLRTACTYILGDLLGVGAPSDSGPAENPTRLAMRSPSPNPFGASAVVQFALPAAAQTRLEVFGVNGRRVRTLLEAPLPAGTHRVQWNGMDESDHPAPCGVYVIRLQAGNARLERRIVRVH